MLSWLMAKYYDKIMKDAEDRCLQDWRASLLSQAFGAILEIGPGTGANLPYYPSAVSSLSLLEPEKNMARQLNEKISHFTRFPIELLSGNAESIPYPDATFNTIVSTLVLCSVKNPKKALAELNRVLAPNGKLIFIEHVAACKNTPRFKWQRRFEPFWKFIALGCHLTRDTETLLTESGFEISDITRQSIRGVPSIVRPSIRGIAIKKDPNLLHK